MGNELSSIDATISPYIIDDNYEINYELDWTEVIQNFIMRYRRILGFVILIILIAIMRTCNTTKNQKIWVGKGGAVAAAPVAAALASGAGAGGAAAAAGSLGTAVAGSGGAAAAAGAASSGGASALASAAGQSVAANAAQNMAKDATSNAKSNGQSNAKTGNSSGASRKIMDFATGGKYSEMRNVGMSRFGSGLELTRQAGQYGADKFKEFANWLYEILFAIAISIAICMMVVPSIAFFILGLICYFLLRKKIMTMKAF